MAAIALTPPGSPDLNIPLDCKDVVHQKPREVTAERLVQMTMHERIHSIDSATCAPGEDDAFFVADLGEVYRLHAEWRRRLGRVTPFFGWLPPRRSMRSEADWILLQQQNRTPICMC